jgi:hypothetical protein
MVERSRANPPLVLRLAAATLGFAVAVTLARLLVAPAPDDQAAGFMTAHGLDATGPMKSMVLAVLFPLVAALLVEPLYRRYLAGARPWALRFLAAAWIGALALPLAGSGFPTMLLYAGGATALGLALRNEPVVFGRRDLVLAPLFLTLSVLVTLAFRRLEPIDSLVIAFLLLALLRAIASRAVRSAAPAAAFSFAPLFLVPVVFSRSPFVAGASLAGLAAAFALALYLFRRGRGGEVSAVRVTDFVSYPLFSWALAWLVRPIASEGLPRVDVFEHGHFLLPAGEMLRGEMPWRDVTVGHGLFSDGLFDFLVVAIGRDGSLGAVLSAREAFESLLGPALYFVGLAATSSGGAAVLGVILACILRVFWTSLEPPLPAILWTPSLRSLGLIAALALVVSAVRLRAPRRLAAAAAVGVATFFVSVDFGAYALLLVGIAAVLHARKRGSWRVTMNVAAAALLASAAAAALIASFGLLRDFLRVTFTEVLTLAPAYAIGYFQFPERLALHRGFPDVLALLFAPSGVWFVAWVIVLISTVVWLADAIRRPLRRSDSIWFIALTVVILGVAYGERLNVHFMPLVSLLIAVSLFALWRRTRFATKEVAWMAIAIAIVMAAPGRQLPRFLEQIRSQPADSVDFATITSPPRAAGALFPRSSIPPLESAGRFIEEQLAPGETFFDFASMPILYYLFDKPVPIRQYEVPFFQNERLQREVISRIESDPTVRAVLLAFPDRNLPIDGVPSSVRAPLVASYIRQNFVPSFSENGVVFWRRAD